MQKRKQAKVKQLDSRTSKKKNLKKKHEKEINKFFARNNLKLFQAIIEN